VALGGACPGLLSLSFGARLLCTHTVILSISLCLLAKPHKCGLHARFDSTLHKRAGSRAPACGMVPVGALCVRQAALTVCLCGFTFVARVVEGGGWAGSRQAVVARLSFVTGPG
jgi:hypothetical protein